MEGIGDQNTQGIESGLEADKFENAPTRTGNHTILIFFRFFILLLFLFFADLLAAEDFFFFDIFLRDCIKLFICFPRTLLFN